MWSSQYLTSTLLLWPAIFQLSSAAAITPRDLQSFVWNSAGGFTMAADSGCSDKNPHNPKETKYDFLWRGFAGANELAQVTWDRFSKNTYPELKKGTPDEKKQKEVDAKDPTYTQFFAMDWSSEGLDQIHSTLQKMQAFNSDPGKDGRPKTDLESRFHANRSTMLRGQTGATDRMETSPMPGFKTSPTTTKEINKEASSTCATTSSHSPTSIRIKRHRKRHTRKTLLQMMIGRPFDTFLTTAMEHRP